MHFVQFTKVLSNEKVAVLSDSVKSFEETTIEIDDAEKTCVKINLKDGNWFKVSEDFQAMLEQMKE